MFSINDLFNLLDEIAPIRISHEAIKNGEYDNSGIIVKSHNEIKKVLFSLDLSKESVQKAKKLGCDTIVTHHPAIYYPIKNLAFDGENAEVLSAIQNKLNVISMHLNLDMAEGGIDSCLCDNLGGNKYRILQNLCGNIGYGREFSFNGNYSDLIKLVKKNFNTDKVLCYGKRNEKINKVASFCGAGAKMALDLVYENKTDADVIITSDMAHHQVKALTDLGKKIIILSHYCSEEYGFRKFYERVNEKLAGKIQTAYFDDKRLR